MDVVLMMMHLRETKKRREDGRRSSADGQRQNTCRHSDMINCVKHGIHRPDVYAFTIDTIQESGSKANKMPHENT